MYLCFPLLLCLLSGYCCLAQEPVSRVSGVLYGTDTSAVLPEVQVLLPALKLLVVSGADGAFVLSPVPYAHYELVLVSASGQSDTIAISVFQPGTDLGSIYTKIKPVIAYTSVMSADPVLPDDNNDQQAAVSAALHSSGNIFQNTAAFSWSTYGFRQRGYDANNRSVLINGIPAHDLMSGKPAWNLWNGLNDVFRNTAAVYGLLSSEEGFGGLNGITAYDINAAQQSPGTRVSCDLSNRSFRHRIAFRHNNALSAKGWSWFLAFNRKWTTEGYIPGTTLESDAAAAGLSKIFSARQESHLVLLSPFSVRSGSAAVTDELYALAGTHYYNPNWGWQNGVKRNARTDRNWSPAIIFNHQYTASARSSLKIALALQYDDQQRSGLDWYKAADPRPDYYRNMPSFLGATDTGAATAVTAAIKNNPGLLQIDWQRLYTVNKHNREQLMNAGGITGNTVMGNRSVYVIGTDVQWGLKYSLAAGWKYKLGHSAYLYAGTTAVYQRMVLYKRLDDLLGGEYFLNYNQFAEQQYSGNHLMMQHDLNVPDRAVYKGDRYHYEYNVYFGAHTAWTQLELDRRNWSGFAAFQLVNNSYQREGVYRNGLFGADASGRSRKYSFTGWSGKAGITLKLNGRNYLFGRAYYERKDPGFSNLFIAPSVHNRTVPGIGMSTIASTEAGYRMSAPMIDIQITGYATAGRGGTDIRRFYNDDPASQGFVDFVLLDVSTCYTGVEAGIEYRYSPALSFTAALAMGQAYYTNRPSVKVYAENDTVRTAAQSQVYLGNYYLGAGPQSAFNAGVTINGNRYWFFRISGSCLARNFLSVNPARRTALAAGLLQQDDPLYQRIFRQEELPMAATLDLFAGKSFRLRKYYKALPYKLKLSIYAGVSNVLNNTNIKTGGYEQLRYDFTGSNPDKFPSKYYYAMGRTFQLNLSLNL